MGTRTMFDGAMMSGKNHGDAVPEQVVCHDGRPAEGRWNMAVGSARKPGSIWDVQQADPRSLPEPTWHTPATGHCTDATEAEYETVARVFGLLAAYYGHLAAAELFRAQGGAAALRASERAALASYDRLPLWARPW